METLDFLGHCTCLKLPPGKGASHFSPYLLEIACNDGQLGSEGFRKVLQAFWKVSESCFTFRSVLEASYRFQTILEVSLKGS